MKVYLVGGSVRDRILSRGIHDRDFVVVGATEKEMKQFGKRVGKGFPVFISDDGIEYAMARREKSIGDSHTDFEVEFGPDVTIEEDAQRRDFTMNAMYDEMLPGFRKALEKDSGEVLPGFHSDNHFIDPTGKGLADIRSGIVRHISDSSFVEDPLRVLRACRFAATLDFEIADETMELMKSMKNMLSTLPRERIDGELYKAMAPEANSSKFIETMNECGALEVCYPEIYALEDNLEQLKYHTAGNTLGHTLMALDVIRSAPAHIKIATLYHDVYKPIAYSKREEARKNLRDEYHPHDGADAVDYFKSIAGKNRRVFTIRTRVLCEVVIKNHMRIWSLYDGMAAKKWVDFVDSITRGFSKDYEYILWDLLDCCNADDKSDKLPQRRTKEGDRIPLLRKALEETFDCCTNIQGRHIPGFMEMKPENLKTEIRCARISAVKRLGFWKEIKEYREH